MASPAGVRGPCRSAPSARPHIAGTVRAWMPASLLLLVVALAFAPAQAQCLNEDSVDARANGAGAAPAADAGDPRLRLQGMVHDALRMSQAVGAAKLLADAAADDTSATEAARKATVTLGGTMAYVGAGSGRGGTTSGGQAAASLNINALLFDGGRNAELTDWRRQLAEAARLGAISAEDQVALQTVSLAIERSRYRLQIQIYQQFGRKMGCLVEALDQIVRADKGRASELVQARKSQQQAELSQVQAASALKQVETRLQRLIGANLPSAEGMSSLLLAPPPLPEIMAEADRAPDIVRLEAQARAAESQARSVAAEGRPQANWVFGGSKAVGAIKASAWQAGININVPLVTPSVEPSAQAARKRAEAAQLQMVDALETRRYRMVEVHEQATSAFDRARRTIDVVRDSDRLRNFTLQQWQQLGKRSLFDVMSAEGEHYALRVAYVNSLHDGQQSTALLRSLGRGITAWLD